MEIMVEPTILETNASGELRIPAGVLGAGPRARFRLEHEGHALRAGKTSTIDELAHRY